MTEKPELEDDYGSKVDVLVDSMGEKIEPPIAPPTDQDVNAIHREMLNDPRYTVHMHERQLERLTTFVEELAERLIALEKQIIPVDPNDPLKDYPEVKQ